MSRQVKQLTIRQHRGSQRLQSFQILFQLAQNLMPQGHRHQHRQQYRRQYHLRLQLHLKLLVRLCLGN